MKFLITGCAGFIGSHLSESLLKQNNIIIGIDNINDYYDINLKYKNIEILKKYNNFTFLKEDIINTKCIDTYKPDIVINMAGMAGVRYSLNNPTLYSDTNITGFINLLEQSKNNNVKMFIYASSSSVYGLNQKIPFNENDIIDNLNSPYAATKYCSEIFANLYNHLYKLKIVGLRFFTVYGPRGRPDMAPYKFLHNINNEIPIDKYGDGTSQRDYTYIDDIINGILGVISNINNINNEIYNLGNSHTISLNDFIQTCEKVVGKKAIINQMSNQKGDVPITYSDISKARKELNYNPQTDIEDGLRKMFKTMG